MAHHATRLPPNRQPLTARQQEALDYIAHSVDERGYPPTLREIGEHMGIRSTNGVNDHLKALERKGYIVREDLKSRALRPIRSMADDEMVLYARVVSDGHGGAVVIVRSRTGSRTSPHVPGIFGAEVDSAAAEIVRLARTVESLVAG